MHRKEIIVVGVVAAGIVLGLMAAERRSCKILGPDPGQLLTHSPDESVQVALYTTTCRRWWAREDDQNTLSYVMLPGGEQPPATPNEADIVYQVDWLKAGGRSEATSVPKAEMGTEEEVRRGILLMCEPSWCPKQEAILKQVNQWRGHRIFYERQ